MTLSSLQIQYKAYGLLLEKAVLFFRVMGKHQLTLTFGIGVKFAAFPSSGPKIHLQDSSLY